MHISARAVLPDRISLKLTAPLPACRPRLQPRALVRAGAAGAAEDASRTINNVLFTMPKRLEYGQCLCLTGEGDGLGEWSPGNSLQLKWNEGDVWGAEVPLPAGQQLEYKYIITQSDGSLATWQPGENCAVKVPAGSGHRLQVIDDWLGKSRSVVYDDGEIGTPPSGTFDASMSIEEAAYDENEEAARGSGAAYTSASQNGNGASHQEAAPSSMSGQTAGASDHGHIVPEVSDSSGGDSSLVNSVDDLDTMTVRDLKDRLKRAGLPISGRKSDLVGRLASNQGAR